MGDLLCPTCKQGKIMAGKRGWGCTRWREGCSFVVWFEENGQKRSEADLRRIVAGGESNHIASLPEVGIKR
jgi:DNA topoisomerase-3